MRSHIARWLFAGLGLIFAAFVVSSNAQASADISGVPNLPSYPCIGKIGLVGVIPYSYFDCPTEANGTHYHCQQGGVNLSGGAFTGTNGFGLGGLGTFGFVFGDCYFAWPDNSYGPAPNPPGAWKNFLVPGPVPIQHTAPPQPYDQTLDVAPPPVLPPAPPADAPPDAPRPVAVAPPQVIPPPIVAQPTITAPVVPGESPETLAAPPDKQGQQVPPGQGVVPPNLSPRDTNPTPPDSDSLRREGG